MDLDAEQLQEELADLDGVAEMMADASADLATGYEWDQVADRLMDSYDITYTQATAIALLMDSDQWG